MFRFVGLAMIVSLAPFTQGSAAQMSHARGEAALHAAKLAAPHVPETLDDVIRTSVYLDVHRFELFDANHDGALTPEEWQEYVFTSYAVHNKARDGRILRDEFAAVINGPKQQPFTVGTMPTSTIESLFRSLDQGHKGYLTIDDLRDEAMKTFRKSDKNGDGKVTDEELHSNKRYHGD
jgi:hypothetical protein